MPPHLTAKEARTEKGAELLAICLEISADDRLDLNEIKSLRRWLRDNRGVGFPAIRYLAELLDRITEDKVVDAGERRELLDAIQSIQPQESEGDGSVKERPTPDSWDDGELTLEPIQPNPQTNGGKARQRHGVTGRNVEALSEQIEDQVAEPKERMRQVRRISKQGALILPGLIVFFSGIKAGFSGIVVAVILAPFIFVAVRVPFWIIYRCWSCSTSWCMLPTGRKEISGGQERTEFQCIKCRRAKWVSHKRRRSRISDIWGEP